jgi:hypothetical protein
VPGQCWALDTNVLYHAAACGHPAADADMAFEATLALTAICGGRHSLVEDTEGRIAREYWRAWGRMEKNQNEYPSRQIVHEFWKRAFLGATVQVQRPVPAAVKAQLLAANMKHDGDIAFIEAAAGTPHKLLVTEDSDFYSPEIIELLRDTPEVSVKVHNYPDATAAANAHAAE